MPIEIHSQSPDEANLADSEVAELLFQEDGSLTAEGDILDAFMEEVEWGDLLDDEDYAPFIDCHEGFAVVEADDYVEAEKGAEGAFAVIVESMDGELASVLVDMDDLVSMFEFYVQNEMPADGLEEQARKQIALAILGEEGVDEKFKRGTFQKMRKDPGAGTLLVKRMLGAMMHKQAIVRAGPGKGNKVAGKKSDWKRHPSGYAPGTPKGIKKWKKYVTGKGKAKAAKLKKKSKKGARKLAAIAKGKSKKKSIKKATGKKGKAKKEALELAASILAERSGKPAESVLAQTESTSGVTDYSVLTEGSKLSGSALSQMKARPLVGGEAKS